MQGLSTFESNLEVLRIARLPFDERIADFYCSSFGYPEEWTKLSLRSEAKISKK